ncbi:MAG: hypothetical protein H8E16_18165, partial [Flavobacteriales bacterium]|nr:hypothetical protein [Flavobacteriales bacterium]
MKEYIVDGQIYQVSDDKLEKFLKDFPNAVLKEETIEPVKPTAVVQSATAGEEIALNTELPLEDGSLESPKKGREGKNVYQGIVEEMRSRGGKILLPKTGDDKDFESMDFIDESGTELKMGTINVVGGQSRVLTYLNEARYATSKFVLDKAIDLVSSESKHSEGNVLQKYLAPIKEKFNEIDAIEDPVEKQKAVNDFVGNVGTLGLFDLSETANKGLDVYEEATAKAEELSKSLTQFDTTIGQAFAQGNFVEGISRSVSKAIGSIPFMAEAMIPYVGIPAIVAQEAARASGEAQREGDEIDLQLIGYSGIVGFSEGLLELTTKKIGKGMFKNLFGQSDKVVKETLSETFLKIAKDMGAEGLSESATLTINNAASSIIRGDENAWEGYVSELIDTFIIGTTSGGGPSSIGAGAKVVRGIIEKRNINKDLKQTNFTNLSEAFGEGKRTSWNPSEGNIKLVENKNSKKFLDFDLKQKVSKGEMTIEEADAIKKNFNDTQGSVNRLKPLGLTDQSQIEAVDLLYKKRELQKTIDTAKEKAVVQEEIDQIEVINDKLRVISKDNAALKRGEDVKTTSEFAEELGFELVQDTKTEDLQKIAPKGFDAKTDYGFIQGNKIYLNNDIIGETNEVKTASHELLHGILTKSILDGDMTKDSVEKFVKDSFGKEGFDMISRTMEAMGYDQAYLEKRPDEYLTQLYESDMLGKPGAFEKVARFVEGIVSKMTLGKFNPKFTNKEDLGIFLREFKQSIETGKMSERLKGSKFFPTDKDGNIIKAKETDITALSKTIVAENKRLSEQLKTATTQEAVDIKNDLALNNEGIVNDFVNSKFKSGLGITKEEFKSGVQEEVLVYLNRTYDPSKGEYGAYLREGLFGGGKFGGGRLGNILKRLGQEGDLFTKEIDDRTTAETLDTTTEEITEKVAEKPTKAKESLRKKIKLDKATTQKVVDAVTKTFGTKLPPVDSPQFKKALQKGFRTELKTTIAKDVLGSRAAYETFLRDNFENIYEAIPQEIINKRFRQFAEDTGKREKTKEGKKIFKKKNIVKAEFIKYFLGRDVGTSTKGTRKDALAEALAEEFAFDATMETIQKPEVVEKREFVDKTQTTEKVSKAIDRPTDFAFSKTASNNQNLNRSLRSLKSEDQTIYRGLLPEFISSIAIDNYNVDAAFQSVFGNFLNKSDGAPSKKREEIISEWKKVRKSIIKNQKDFETGKPKKININDYLTQAFEEQTETEIVRNILGVANGGVNFRDDKQIMGYVNFMNELVGLKMQEFKGDDLKIADYVVNILGPTLSAGAKVGGNNFIWELNNETDLLHLVPSTLERGDSLRTSIFGNQKEMSEVLIKPFLKKPELLTYKGNAPQYNGKPLLKPKVAQKVDTYVTSLNKTGGISKNMLDDSASYAKKNQDAIIDILDFYKGLNKESEITINDLAMFFAASNGDMTALVRAAARVDSFAKSNSKNKKDYRYEHNPPARTMLVNMAKYINGQMTLKELKKGFDSYTVSIIPKQMDDVINERYKDSSPLIGSRYYNSFTFGRFPFSMTVYEKQNDGNYKTKTLGAFAPQAYKEVQTAKAKNINSLPSKIQTKFSKTSSNKNVLDEMQKLDKEASDARIAFSKGKNLNKDFNDIIEKATGIGTEKQYGQTKARAVGADKGKWDWAGIPPSAQDFVGLTRFFAGKGKEGDKTIAWVKENFLDPFARANIDISNARVALANDFKGLKKLLKISPKDLNKKIPGEPYTVGSAIRVYTWTQQGITVPGLSKADTKILNDYVTNNSNLVTFANELIAINKDNGYPKPGNGWLAGTITTDLLTGLNTTVRAKYLQQWQDNVDQVFTEANMNKLEAAFGKGYRDALENMLGRMKTGSNRGFKGDTLTGRFIDWINGSVGAIMFFNMRSAVLQTISAINFINWSDNSPIHAAKAFANQPQYWKDVVDLMNSDYLVERRNGLKINVSEADIAEIAAESKNKAKAFIHKILKLGFLPTQIADSFAIATGGATLYRN